MIRMNNKWWTIRLVIVLLVVSVTGCAERSGENIDVKPTRILCFMKNEGDSTDVWRQIYYGLRDAVGENSQYKISVYIYDEANNLTQTDRITCALLIRPDVVLLRASSWDGFIERLTELDDAYIRYIIFDGKDLPETNRLGFISSDNWAAGYQALEVLMNLIKAPLQIGLVNAGFHSQSVTEREESFRNAVMEQENCEIVKYISSKNQGSLLENIENVQMMLEENPGINALFCSDSVAGQAAADVVRELGLADTIQIVCFDTNEYILDAVESGLIDAAIMQSTYNMGQLCLQVLENPDGPKTYYTDCVIISKDNLELAR